jgi:drug/metabolite transporter (DMT)-like permease
LTLSASKKLSTSKETDGAVPGQKGAGTGGHPVLRGYIYIALATLFWGISAGLGRAVFTGRLTLGSGAMMPIEPLILAQSRTTISFLVLAPILLWKRGRAGLRMEWREFGQCVLLGTLGVAASNFLYYYAIQQTTVATAIILQYTAPVFVLLYMVMSGQQHATPQRVSGVALSVLGCVFAIGVVTWARAFPWLGLNTRNMRYNTLGVAAALGAAVAFSFYNIFARHLVERRNRWNVLLYALLGAAMGWMIVNPPWKVIAAHYTGSQWIFLVLFAVTSVLIPFSLYFAGLAHLDPTRAIVTSCLEPVFAILIAVVTLGELVGPLQVVGIVLTLTATVLVQLPEREERAMVVEPIE